MHSIEHLSGQLRSLRLNSLSQAAGNLIAQAEENESDLFRNLVTQLKIMDTCNQVKS